MATCLCIALNIDSYALSWRIMHKPEIRKDYFKDKYVIIAPNRSKRPRLIKKSTEKESGQTCHFCPQNFKDEIVTYQENNDNNDWEIISIVNKFSALSLDNPLAYGQCEVIIETRKHGLDINEFSVDHIVRVLDAYIVRYGILKNVDGIKYVIAFKNEGGKAGASVAHTHSQIIALPMIPPKVQEEIDDYDKYSQKNGTCPYCDIIIKETDGPRVIWEDENLFVVAPYASESPYEAWLIPKRHINEVSNLTHGEKVSISTSLKIVLDKLDGLGISYNYFIENTIDDKDYHTHIKLSPRPNVWAGLELGTGIIINPVSPEYAAKVYLNLHKGKDTI
jgi:UDPglucose--hexose-1-phosphate uridylyltransferase